MLTIIAFAWLFGALIGYSASQKKGFSPVAGVLGGLLLGIFSPLMFLVSSERKRCPQCAEWIQNQALLCPHCRTDLA